MHARLLSLNGEQRFKLLLLLLYYCIDLKKKKCLMYVVVTKCSYIVQILNHYIIFWRKKLLRICKNFGRDLLTNDKTYIWTVSFDLVRSK